MAKNDTNLPYGLHRPAKGNGYWYCRWWDGVRRRSRSTKTKSLKQAIRIAGEILASELGEGISFSRTKRLPDVSVREAFGRYYVERASHLKSAGEILVKLKRMTKAFGPDRPISKLTMDDLLQYQTARRNSGVSNRTVNYEVPETIRPFFHHAQKWGVDTGELGQLSEPQWRELKLPLPPPRTRTATRDELRAFFQHIRPDYRPILVFELYTGLRRNALLMKRDQIRWEEQRFWYPKKSRLTGDIGWFPITRALERILRREIERGGEDCEWVFTYEAQLGPKRGNRQPIAVEGLKTEMQRVKKATGISNWRLFHDFRHTAATFMMRKTGNMALVQMALGHSSITQTQKYAHLVVDDLRLGLEKRPPLV